MKPPEKQQELIPLAPGEYLKQQRILKKLSLAAVAEAIRLDEKLLSAIELDEAGHIAAVYRKGYIKAYARFLQIPQDEISALIASTDKNDPVIRNVFAAPPNRNPLDKWLRAISYVLASLLIGTLAWQFTHEAVRLSQGGSQLPRDPVNVPQTHELNGPVNASIASLEVLHNNGRSGRDTAEQVWAAVSQAVLAEGESSLQISVSADSWVEITDADGLELEMDLLRGGSEKRYQGKPPFRILFGRASAVRLSVNGTPIDITAFTVDDVAQMSWPEETHAENQLTGEQPIDQ